MKKKLIILLLLIALTLPSIYFLFHPGFVKSDDGEWMIIRFSAFYEALRDGQFPVRFLGRLNHGYGYPISQFLYPGFMYVGVPIHVLGFGFIETIKIILGAAIIFSGIFAYLWLSILFGKFASFMGALVYVYAPYHLYDLYERGSVGELLAFAIVPFILWQIERKSIVWESIGIGALILSHNTLALLFLPILFVYGIIRSKKTIYYQLLTILFGLGLSAFFWIPAIFELSYTQFSKTQVSKFENYFTEPILIGYFSFVILGISLLILAQKLRKKEKLEHEFTFFFLISLASIFFSLSLSKPLWNIFPVSFIQFPFRALSYLILGISFLTAFVVARARREIKIVIVGLFFLFNVSYLILVDPDFNYYPESFYSTNEGTTTVQDEYMPFWVKQKPVEHFKEKVEILDGSGEFIKSPFYSSKKIEFFPPDRIRKVRVNTIYYPGWKAYVNGKEVTIDYKNEKGVMDIEVPSGSHKVELLFTETPLRLFADAISVFSLLVLLFYRNMMFSTSEVE